MWTELISLVPYITLWWNFCECVWQCACMSSTSKTLLQPFIVKHSAQLNSSVGHES